MPSVSKVSPRIRKNFIKLKGRLIKLSLFFFDCLRIPYRISRIFELFVFLSCALKNSALLAISFLIFDLIDEK